MKFSGLDLVIEAETAGCDQENPTSRQQAVAVDDPILLEAAGYGADPLTLGHHKHGRVVDRPRPIELLPDKEEQPRDSRKKDEEEGQQPAEEDDDGALASLPAALRRLGSAFRL